MFFCFYKIFSLKMKSYKELYSIFTQRITNVYKYLYVFFLIFLFLQNKPESCAYIQLAS